MRFYLVRVVGVFLSKDDAVTHANDVYKQEAYDCDYGPPVSVDAWEVGDGLPCQRWEHDECRQWWD